MLYIHKKKTFFDPTPPLFCLSLHTFKCCRSKWGISLAGQARASRTFLFITASLACSRAEIWPSSIGTSNRSLSFRLPGNKNCCTIFHSLRSQKYAPNRFHGMFRCTSSGCWRVVNFFFFQRFFTRPKFFERLVLLAERQKKKRKQKKNGVASIGPLFFLIVAEQFFSTQTWLPPQKKKFWPLREQVLSHWLKFTVARTLCLFLVSLACSCWGVLVFLNETWFFFAAPGSSGRAKSGAGLKRESV